MNAHILIHRIDRAILRKYNFVLDFHYYLMRGYRLRAAWFMARNTL